jgi:CRISPR-associated protein Cmr6
MKNLNLLFNKTYYNGFGKPDFKDQLTKNNETLSSTRFVPSRDYVPSKVANSTFVLETVYPGLLAGLGNPHGVGGASDNDIKAGFSFDYVTGQPYIPGSSVKGVLRHYFEKHPSVIALSLGDEQIDIETLMIEIFDEGDVFLDAVVKRGDSSGHILGFDYITHHKKETTTPVPIQIIKLIPGVQIEFRFKLKDGVISSEKKASLFKRLLVLFGVGAKTNVGYGILKDSQASYTKEVSNASSTVSKAHTVDMIICECGTKNYKYNINTKKVHWNWEKGICRNNNCRKKLNIN